MKTITQIANELGQLVESKDAAYGNAFDKAGDFLKILYPQGISPNQYADMLCLVRIFDKQMRIATKKDAFGENPFNDIAGYGLLGCRRYANEEERRATLERINKMEQDLKAQVQTTTTPKIITPSAWKMPDEVGEFRSKDEEISAELSSKFFSSKDRT